MRYAVFAVLALTGCTTLDANVQKNLPQICAAADQAYAGYVAISAVKPPSAKTARRVEQAHSVLVPLCADPSHATAASVVTAAFLAYATISQAAKQGE